MVEIDGNEYVGEISIPAIGVGLPVMSEWSYPRLKIAPAASSALPAPMIWSLRRTTTSHFRQMTSLTAGTACSLTDMDGIVNEYVVNKVKV